MHIDLERLTVQTEGDVETRLLLPLLQGEAYLHLPSETIFSKEYLAPSAIDKGAKVTGGYYPDFSVWMLGFPVLLVEAKAPGVPAELGFREAQLYARHLNVKYSAGFNPCRFVLSSNGERLLFGEWDSEPSIDASPQSLNVGGQTLQSLIEAIGANALRQHAEQCLAQVRGTRGIRPFNRAGGQALVNARQALNSFAPQLSPVITRYFSSTGSEDVREIAERAYVSSAEITEYDRVLEALLKDRISTRRDTVIEPLRPTRRSEPQIDKAIGDFAASRPAVGQLQIIQGSVGAGKSLFLRRYKEVLQPQGLRDKTRWAFINFNGGPPDLSTAQNWLCDEFQDSFASENPSFDLSSMDVLRGIFAKKVQRRKGIYDDVAKSSEEQAALLRNNDLMSWQDDSQEYAKGLANYVLGIRQEVLVVVMDNVDRLSLKDQLDAFQLALWFMEHTKCFVIIQMRDETYERFKNRPPLDTFRTGITFHISPPRFIDVVKKRLELSLAYLANHSEATQTYSLPSGARITIPQSELGVFLRELYIELFERRRNISRVLEALSGRDVRKALEMFVAIITSGHLNEDQITSQVRGGGEIRISEHNIIRILMRNIYRHFSDNSGFITNIFGYQNDWERPNNFIYPELLFYLASLRKKTGQIGLEGYFTVDAIANELQKRGITRKDTLAAANYLLMRGLLVADHMGTASVDWNDCVKISASGYIHLRVLAERIEYNFGVIATTPIADETASAVLADFVARENRLGNLSSRSKVDAVEKLYDYLHGQATTMARRSGREFDLEDQSSGTAYVLREMKSGIDRFYRGGGHPMEQGNLLDA